ncbi:MAG: symporter small accessory protein [Desulfovibrio sp.]
MLGLQGTEIAIVFWLSIFSSLFCVYYGVTNWNATESEATLKQDSDQR